MIKKISKRVNQIKKHNRIRKKLNGTAEQLRACVFRSNLSLYIQFIDDDAGKVIAGYSTQQKEFKKDDKINKNNIARAKAFGKFVGERVKEKKITQVIFDRCGYKFHGRIKALADGLREQGIKF